MSNPQRLGAWFSLGFIILLLGCQSEQPSTTANPNNTETTGSVPTEPVPIIISPKPSQVSPAKPPTTTAAAPPQSAIPESFIADGTLTAKDPKAKINLRSTASATSKLLGYGVVGDRVKVIAQKETEGYTWSLVKFPKSDTKAWIRGDFIKIATQSDPAASPLPSVAPKSTAGSPIRKPVAAGNCECPYDTDKAGKACGARSAYVKAQGRRPVCYVGE